MQPIGIVRVSDNCSETLITMCQDCYTLQGTCDRAQSCAFQEDTSNEPKFIREQNSVIIVPNPSLIEKTCKVSCSCFSEEKGCLRQNISSYEGEF